ncbi:Nramp family divalent metal transporter [Mesobacillus foraminis]|uniref:Mn2+/Fe2+ NRAMP family transporter n=1 Tax=Mesobacillus foraminis TaxID=279826 RepID=A0A4R2AZW6_9BACI|nr:Nramp family divalent metal transporter [Mesobacillus foraminis]TCN19717.1 Mn2+/Fe2+ NRAMP family transporter [Mesobacillus foraminis]
MADINTNLNKENPVLPSTDVSDEQLGAPIPKTFWEYIKSFGPGIVVVLTWLGAGDLVDSSLAGAHYGYTLMWGLVLALVMRYILVDIIAKFQLLNIQGLSIMEGYGKISPIIPVILGIGGVLLGHFYVAFLAKGVGESIALLTGTGSTLLWATVAVFAGFLITGRSVYSYLELTEKIVLAIMAISLIGGAMLVGPSWGEMAKGTFTFDVPDKVGSFDALLIVASLIGAVGGSLANLLYPTFMKEKGYIRPEHRKVQRYDLLFGIFIIIVLDLAVWVIGAEVLHPRGIEITSFQGLAESLGMVLGPLGTVIIYLGVFGACFSGVIGYPAGFPKMGIEGIYIAKPERKDKYSSYKKDPIYRLYYFTVLFLPLIWSIPGMPGFIWLTVVVNAAQLILLPLVSIGLLYLINRKDLMGKEARKPLDNVLLLFLTALALWGTYQTAVSLFS